ncbi:helical backbone metal receptor [Mucilaginibacter sp. RB4R14]|uniref:ABC transporter substrate-binding protein n=1 Tax=Mucilaginibacter aurantiaciroseus TaxID=2949308 RepID=UPI00209118C3|nr:helical backbone metal receptor [Mucilaginibacter aurantiaciroseus]MCO5934923.1 helical backbone metal receptor [Mucilaginibacter aurantiaciroseus]
MPVFYDQMNNAVNLPETPSRIISIVPSQTELLFDLGLDGHIVGITKFCIHPEGKVKLATKIGGTKQLNLQAIHKLQPDLIIANKEENEKSQVEELMKHYPVWISDIHDLHSALSMINKVGEITGKQTEASTISNVIFKCFGYLKPTNKQTRVAYLIWRKPYMAAGQGTFINSLLNLCGFKNVFAASRYPDVSKEELVAADPEVILLSSEPYPFAQKHIDEFNEMLPHAKILLVNGELFSWYGSRLLHSPAYFNKLIDKLTAM